MPKDDKRRGSIRRALNKLFGNEVIVRSTSGDQIKTVDVRQSQAVTQSFHHDKYRRMYQGGGVGGYGGQPNQHSFYTNRVSLFRDYEEMDEDPIISSALDIYANEAATKDAFGGIIDVECENGEIKSILENLIYDILHVQDNARWWARSVAKYGDLFMKLEVYEKYGVVNAKPLSPYAVHRHEDPDSGRTIFQYEEDGYSNSSSNNSSVSFEEWEIAHFRFTNDSNFFPYGKSIIENGRKIWKQLSLMEEAMLIHRIMRAPEKRVFKIDIGNIEPDAVDSYMQGIINDIQQTPLVDPQTGQYNLEFNMRNMLEDFFLPVRGRESGTEIQSLQGLQYQVIEDVDYLRKKLMSSLKIPNAFLGYEADIQGKCIDPKTKIPLVSGEIKTAEEIIQHFEDDNEETLWAYSYNHESQKIVAGEIVAGEMTRKDARVVDVVLDNGETVTTTPDHKFMLRSGEYVEAQNLKNGDSLMPFYTDKTSEKKMKGYTTVYQPKTDTYEPFHRTVEEQFNLKEKDGGSVIHHSDFNKLNNNPNNLDCSMTFWEHRKFHQDHANKTINSPENIQKRINDPSWIESAGRGGIKGGNSNADWLSNYASGREPANKNGSFVTCHNCGKEIYKSKSRLNREQEVFYCSHSCAAQVNLKVNRVSLDQDEIVQKAQHSTSFNDLCCQLDVSRKTLYDRIERFFGSRYQFAIEYMPNISKNSMRQIPRKNHVVTDVVVREEKMDTCDIQVAKYHNFAVSSGIIIHNSTLAQESIKFANAVRNLQESLAQELKKIALVHLYTKGYENEDLVGFNFKFTNPSIVAEQERIEFLSRKAGVARDLRELPIHSDKWIAKNIFNMSEDEYEEQLREKVRDWKRNFRKDQIEREGNDPVKTGQSFGTPSDLAASGSNNLKQLDFEDDADGKVADERTGEFNNVTQRDEDPHGLKDISNLLRPKSSDLSQNFQGGSPLALDHIQTQKSGLIQESLSEEIEEFHNQRNTDGSLPENSYMNESIVDTFPDPDRAIEKIFNKSS